MVEVVLAQVQVPMAVLGLLVELLLQLSVQPIGVLAAEARIKHSEKQVGRASLLLVTPQISHPTHRRSTHRAMVLPVNHLRQFYKPQLQTSTQTTLDIKFKLLQTLVSQQVCKPLMRPHLKRVGQVKTLNQPLHILPEPKVSTPSNRLLLQTHSTIFAPMRSTRQEQILGVLPQLPLLLRPMLLPAHPQ